jgi:hypothetical protein
MHNIIDAKTRAAPRETVGIPQYLICEHLLDQRRHTFLVTGFYIALLPDKDQGSHVSLVVHFLGST